MYFVEVAEDLRQEYADAGLLWYDFEPLNVIRHGDGWRKRSPHPRFPRPLASHDSLRGTSPQVLYLVLVEE